MNRTTVGLLATAAASVLLIGGSLTASATGGNHDKPCKPGHSQGKPCKPKPTEQPTEQPSEEPTEQPTEQPSEEPTKQPSTPSKPQPVSPDAPSKKHTSKSSRAHSHEQSRKGVITDNDRNADGVPDVQNAVEEGF